MPVGFGCNLVFAHQRPDGEPSQAYRTLFLQETIARGVLMPSLVVSYSHTDDDVDRTLEAIDGALGVYAKAIEAGTTDGFLVGPPSRHVFDRRFAERSIRRLEQRRAVVESSRRSCSLQHVARPSATASNGMPDRSAMSSKPCAPSDRLSTQSIASWRSGIVRPADRADTGLTTPSCGSPYGARLRYVALALDDVHDRAQHAVRLDHALPRDEPQVVRRRVVLGELAVTPSHERADGKPEAGRVVLPLVVAVGEEVDHAGRRGRGRGAPGWRHGR